MERRAFIGACAASCALSAPDAFPASQLKPRMYGRVRLTDERGVAVPAASLVPGRNYLFHYPYEATPCFLLNLGRPTGAEADLKTGSGAIYHWTGGVGPQRSIVAYSAICAHRLSYPTRQITFISYRERSISPTDPQRNVIHCCSEHSEYDPAAGGRVVGGPAPQPLAAILLEYDARDGGLHAVGTLGGELYEAFFAKFEFKLALDYGNGMRRPVSGRAVVTEMDAFCRQRVRC